MRMQGSTGEGTIRIKKYYGSLAGMRRKFDRRKRQDAFPGGSLKSGSRRNGAFWES